MPHKMNPNDLTGMDQYCGDFFKGKIEGFGQFTWWVGKTQNGAPVSKRFIGEWKQSKMHGIGIMAIPEVVMNPNTARPVFNTNGKPTFTGQRKRQYRKYQN